MPPQPAAWDWLSTLAKRVAVCLPAIDCQHLGCLAGRVSITSESTSESASAKNDEDEEGRG
ncbi:hypothetical protein BN1708_003671 [Verticillium longisporum]|uniref:Uncharacterized protein n=1 Tax=Verticillium longisporum TaxID=100787 RepID=A0A0G4LMY0_VERLO|nr:hypothetical protein BN1708_003671 [Verticillium longisporum]